MNFIDYLVRAPQGIVPRAPHFQASQISTKQARLTDLKTTTTSGSSVNIIPFEEWAATRDIQDAAKPTLAIENAVGAFHILCIHCGIVPAFDITESPLYSFHGKVTFANYVVEEEGPFPSKKDAKKAVALKAMPIVQSLLEANKKAAEQDVQKEGSSVRSDDSHGENYVGILTGASHFRQIITGCHYFNLLNSSHPRVLSSRTPAPTRIQIPPNHCTILHLHHNPQQMAWRHLRRCRTQLHDQESSQVVRSTERRPVAPRKRAHGRQPTTEEESTHKYFR